MVLRVYIFLSFLIVVGCGKTSFEAKRERGESVAGEGDLKPATEGEKVEPKKEDQAGVKLQEILDGAKSCECKMEKDLTTEVYSCKDPKSEDILGKICDAKNLISLLCEKASGIEIIDQVCEAYKQDGSLDKICSGPILPPSPAECGEKKQYCFVSKDHNLILDRDSCELEQILKEGLEVEDLAVCKEQPVKYCLLLGGKPTLHYLLKPEIEGYIKSGFKPLDPMECEQFIERRLVCMEKAGVRYEFNLANDEISIFESKLSYKLIKEGVCITPCENRVYCAEDSSKKLQEVSINSCEVDASLKKLNLSLVNEGKCATCTGVDKEYCAETSTGERKTVKINSCEESAAYQVQHNFKIISDGPCVEVCKGTDSEYCVKTSLGEQQTVKINSCDYDDYFQQNDVKFVSTGSCVEECKGAVFDYCVQAPDGSRKNVRVKNCDYADYLKSNNLKHYKTGLCKEVCTTTTKQKKPKFSPDGTSLKDTLRNSYFTDNIVLGWDDSHSNYLDLNIPGVTFTVIKNSADEWVERRKGGVIDANLSGVLGGIRQYISKYKYNYVPTDLDLKQTFPQTSNYKKFNTSKATSPDGYTGIEGEGLAWGDTSYKYKNYRYSIAYFYHGFWHMNKHHGVSHQNGYGGVDGEIFIIATEKPVNETVKTCEFK